MVKTSKKTEADLNQPIKQAEFWVDFFNYYDIDSNSVVTPNELLPYTEASDAEWNEYCEKNAICNGISASDIPLIMATPGAMQGLKFFTPGMQQFWADAGKSFNPTSEAFTQFEKYESQLEKLTPEIANQVIANIRDFRIEFNSSTNAYYDFFADLYSDRLVAAAQTQSSEELSKTAAKLKNETYDAVQQTGVFWGDYNSYAKDFENSPFYTEAISEYIKASAKNLSYSEFSTLISTMWISSVTLKNPRKLMEFKTKPSEIRAMYSILKEDVPEDFRNVTIYREVNGKIKPEKGTKVVDGKVIAKPIPSGYKRVLLFNKKGNTFELHEVKQDREYPSNGNLIPVVVTKKNGVTIFWGLISKNVPWLANVGKCYLMESAMRAEKKLDKLNISTKVGAFEKGTPLTNVITMESVLSLVYTERNPVELKDANNHKQVADAMLAANVMFALRGQKAYNNDVSSVGAQGIGQIKSATYEGAKKSYFPDPKKSPLGSYGRSMSNMDDSILAMYLVLDDMARIVVYQVINTDVKKGMSKEKIAKARENGMQMAIKFVNSALFQDAVSMYYNQGTSTPADYARTGKSCFFTDYARAFSNVIRYMISV